MTLSEGIRVAPACGRRHESGEAGIHKRFNCRSQALVIPASPDSYRA